MASFVETRGHAGDEGNFEALYATYKSDVQRLASYLLKNASDAEDAAQTVFLNVLRALRQGVTPTDPRAWLLAITRNVCFSRHRAAAARPNFVELDFEAPEEPSGEETPSADEIVGALARMLPNQRTALILRDFRGVSRAEIGHLMALSPAAVEALLTRARATFREELESGEQPFVCAETRALVEKQLDGEITVADRHSLRSHLRNCGPCATLARAVRSSRGKLAGLIFWPVDLISRLAGAFSQASSVTHVATAITSTAAVAAVAIPVAVSPSSGPAHAAWATATPSAKAASTHIPASATRASRPAAGTVAAHSVASKPDVHAGLQRQPLHKVKAAAKPSARSKAGAARSKLAAVTTTATPSMSTTPASARPAQTTATSTTRSATTASQSPSGTRTLASPRSTSPGSTSPHSTSPINRPPAKAKKSKAKPKSVRKPGRRGAVGRHEPEPTAKPPLTPPATDLPATDGSGPATSGPGISVSTDRSPAKSDSSSSSSSSGSNQSPSNQSASADSSPSNGSNGQGDDSNAKDKDKDKGGNGNGGKHKH